MAEYADDEWPTQQPDEATHSDIESDGQPYATGARLRSATEHGGASS
jgi:hypothetical protein